MSAAPVSKKRLQRASARRLLVSVATAAVIACACGAVSPDELSCEEAVSRLENCCPGFQAQRFNCSTGTCNAEYVVVGGRASSCIRDQSCADLASLGACTRLTQVANQPYPSQLEVEKAACK